MGFATILNNLTMPSRRARIGFFDTESGDSFAHRVDSSYSAIMSGAVQSQSSTRTHDVPLRITGILEIAVSSVLPLKGIEGSIWFSAVGSCDTLHPVCIYSPAGPRIHPIGRSLFTYGTCSSAMLTTHMFIPG